MQRHTSSRYLAAIVIVVAVHTTHAQIVGPVVPGGQEFQAVDMVLNAPYRGPITSLRNLCADMPYGENWNVSVPRLVNDAFYTTTSIKVWCVPSDGADDAANWDIHFEAWDRNVIRLYVGADNTQTEIIPGIGTKIQPWNKFNLGSDPSRWYDTQIRQPTVFSVRAMSTTSLTPKTFRLIFLYQPASGESSWHMYSVRVAPVTASAQADLSDAYQYGCAALDVSAGDAHLRVPLGRTVDMIGCGFVNRQTYASDEQIRGPVYELLPPDASESTFIPSWKQFVVGTESSTYGKTFSYGFGRPWAPQLAGCYIDDRKDVFAVNSGHYDLGPLVQGANNLNKLYMPGDPVDPEDPNYVAPLVTYEYDTAINYLVTRITDRMGNAINLIRDQADSRKPVSQVTTTDGRSWTILKNASYQITGVVPNLPENKGARYFSWDAPFEQAGRRSADRTHTYAGRVTQVRTLPGEGEGVLYEFVYDDFTGDLKEEWHGSELTISYEPSTLGQTRKEYVKDSQGATHFRKSDVSYSNEADKYVVSVTDYEGLDGATAHQTKYKYNSPTATDQLDTDHTAGTLDQVELPGATITHSYDAMGLGLRTKTIMGSVTTYDVDYECAWASDSSRLLYSPRITKERDGTGAETSYVYEPAGGDGSGDHSADGVPGQNSNQLWKVSGPAVTRGQSYTPETQYFYYSSGTARGLLERTEVKRDTLRTYKTFYTYDALRRLMTKSVGEGTEQSTTQYRTVDDHNPPYTLVRDPDGYVTQTEYDPAGRLAKVTQYLDPVTTILDASLPIFTARLYRTWYNYDTKGWLIYTRAENKRQRGEWMNGAMPFIATRYTRDDPVGRVTKVEVGTSTLIGEIINVTSVTNYSYTLQGEIEQEYDASGRGVIRTYDGRGLLESERPRKNDGNPDNDLVTTYQYHPNHKLRSKRGPDGVVTEMIYDEALRLKTETRTPASTANGEVPVTTNYVYDGAGRVVRTSVKDNGQFWSDQGQWYDEGGHNYLTRDFPAACETDVTAECDDIDGTARVTKRTFDYAGNVTQEEVYAGGNPSNHLVRTTGYDTAGRIQATADSEGGMAVYTRDGRGNPIRQVTTLDENSEATTDSRFDAMGRPFIVCEPKGGGTAPSFRAYRSREYDSRGNLLIERIFEAPVEVNVDTWTPGDPKQATVYGYDVASRKQWEAVLQQPAAAAAPYTAAANIDRKTSFVYSASDGWRLGQQITYKDNSDAPLVTSMTYDEIGRVKKVTQPNGAWTQDYYYPNGRLEKKDAYDGLGTRTTTYGYDGFSRVISETTAGDATASPPIPDLVRQYRYDALNRQTDAWDSRNVHQLTSYADLLGLQETVTQALGETEERSTVYDRDQLGRLVRQTFHNGAVSQVTTYLYDSMGRVTRIVYPDAGADQHSSPATCTDCVQMTYDDAGRLIEQKSQAPESITTVFEYDDRGLLVQKTSSRAGTDPVDVVEQFTYDLFGRLKTADRGTSLSPTATAHVERYYDYEQTGAAYRGFGDLVGEGQQIAGGPLRPVSFAYDQAGNRTALGYPGGEQFTFTYTPANQVWLIQQNGETKVEYGYVPIGANPGPLFAERKAYAGNSAAWYTFRVGDAAGTPGYDVHRRWARLTNRYHSATNLDTDIVTYGYTHDENSNPLSQATSGLPAFEVPHQSYIVDRLNRLTKTTFGTEATSPADALTLDLAGNRQDFTPQVGPRIEYAAADAVNQYTQIDSQNVTYDSRGNLAVDEEGRRYFYDEENRLTRILPSGDSTPLAVYTHDALGRRIEANLGGIAVRYTYDGKRVLEEYNAAGNRVRYHLNGAQYIDERVATYTCSNPGVTPPVGEFAYYLHKENWSIAGVGRTDGTCDSLIYSPTGDFGGNLPSRDFTGDGSDPEPDGDVDGFDFAFLESCFTGPDVAITATDCHKADLDRDNDVDPTDYVLFQVCMSGQGATPPAGCTSSVPPSGTFVMHGLAVDAIPNGPTLLHARARYYDPKHGRWLQRDPKGYVDGPNLYEAFKGNPLRYVDPAGTQAPGWLAGQPYDVWGQEYRKHLCPPPGTLKRSLASMVIETEGKTLDEIDYDLKEEFYYTGEAVVLMLALFDPVAEATLGQQSPRLASAITDTARYEVGVLGPVQGSLNAIQGVQDIGVGLVDLARRGSPGIQLAIVFVPELEEQTRITSPQWAKGLVLHTSDKTYNWSKGLGGEATVFLVTCGAEAWARGGAANLLPGLHSVPVKPAGSNMSSLFESIAADPKFLRVAGVSESEMLEAVRSASFRYSNPLQGGFAGRVPVAAGGDELVLGLSRLHLRSAPAAHELFHLVRDLRGLQSIGMGEMPGLLGRLSEESLVWGMTFRYAPYATAGELLGHGAVIIGPTVGAGYYIGDRVNR